MRRDVTLTGEITLRGRVLPVGGIKEKMLAAHRAGVRYMIMPLENRRDLSDIPENVRRKVEVKLVEHMDEVLELALAKVEQTKDEGEPVPAVLLKQEESGATQESRLQH